MFVGVEAVRNPIRGVKETSRTKARPPAAAQACLISKDTSKDCLNKLFVTAVESVYEAALDSSLWPRALQQIANCLGDVGAILLWRRDDLAFGSIASSDVVAAQRDWEQEGWNICDLRLIRATERGYFFSGVPFTDRHLLSDEEIHTNPSYTQFQAQHDLGCFGAVAVSPDPHVGIVLCVLRNAKARLAFSDAELDILARLGLHVKKSLRLNVRLFDSEMEKDSLAKAMSSIGIGVFILDSLRRVVFINPVGQSLLGDGLAITNGRLVIAAGPARGPLEVAIDQMCGAIPQEIEQDRKLVVMHQPKTDRPLIIQVLPIAPSSHLAAYFLTHARAIVLAIGINANSPHDPALVRDVWGLTLGEARLAALVGSGLSPRETSERLGITEETARTVLKRVFSKTGVSRQSELVSLLSRIVLH